MELTVLLYRLKSLTAYRGLLAQPPLAAACRLLEALEHREGEAALTAWAELSALLQEEGRDGLSQWLLPALR